MYSIFIKLYLVMARIMAAFDEKARRWVQGRNHWRNALRGFGPGDKPIWFHCASVGEFEQARPVIEQIKSSVPNSKILLTFFSPSGFELRKDYAHADAVTYLPLDSSRNARQFVNCVNPSAVVFVKYEFWINFMQAVHDKGVPFYLICAHFPENHFLLKWPGSLIGRRLVQFSRIFLQDEDSAIHLAEIGVDRTEVIGDTRFDRVIDTRNTVYENQAIDQFVGQSKILVIGSNWPADDAVLLKPLLSKEQLKVIVAPHEMNESQWRQWEKLFSERIVKWSEMQNAEMAQIQVLYVDIIGVLSRLYRYADVAYVGGGFGDAVHNTLEAAVYGIPVIFGPKNARFLEVQQLKELGVGLEVEDAATFEQALEKALNKAEFREEVEKKSIDYFEQSQGASLRIASLLMETK